MTINDLSIDVYGRFQKAAQAIEDEARKAKLETIKFLITDPAGQDLAMASDMLSEIGF